MRKSTTVRWVLPNLHGSQRPLWKGLYKIVILSHSFLFPFHSHCMGIAQVYMLKLPLQTCKVFRVWGCQIILLLGDSPCTSKDH